jgi:hypothetical protein
VQAGSWAEPNVEPFAGPSPKAEPHKVHADLFPAFLARAQFLSLSTVSPFPLVPFDSAMAAVTTDAAFGKTVKQQEVVIPDMPVKDLLSAIP